MATTEEMEKLQRARPGRGRLLIVVAVLVIAVALIAVAVDGGWLCRSGSPKAKTALNGAGATFPCPLITAWSSEFVNVTRAPTTPGPQVTVNYNCVGSGAGITQITSKTVDFAGTDAPLKSSERSAAPGLLHIPETIGAVTASYSVVELSTGIKLRGYTLAEIFRGTITQWNSPNISADNTGIPLPARAIQVVHRSDSSGTTFVFTSFLHLANPWWNVSLVGKAINWPVGIGAQGNAGVAGKIQTTPDAIGYVELAYTVQNNMKVAQIKNHDGQWTTPTLATTAAAAAALSSPPSPGGAWAHVSLPAQPGAASDPLAPLPYPLSHKRLNALTTLARTTPQALVDFLWWVVHGGQDLSEALTYPKLAAGLVTLDEGAIRSITFNGQTLHS